VEQEHGGMFRHLLDSDSKYNTVTEKQKELLDLLRRGLSDQQIASALGIRSSAFGRRQSRQSCTSPSTAWQWKLPLLIKTV
jgi:FixJ family two-component response regulator